MGWETRGGSGRYYTRSTRRDGRVAREYLGRGPAAERAAAADAERRLAREVAREDTRFTAEVDSALAALSEALETLARAALLVGGFHRHARGEWRRRRA